MPRITSSSTPASCSVSDDVGSSKTIARAGGRRARDLDELLLAERELAHEQVDVHVGVDRGQRLLRELAHAPVFSGTPIVGTRPWTSRFSGR